MKAYAHVVLLATAMSAASCSGKDRRVSDDAGGADTCAADGAPDAGSTCQTPTVTVRIQDERGFPLAAERVAFIAPGCDDPVPCESVKGVISDPRAPANAFTCRVGASAISSSSSGGVAMLPLVVGKGEEEYLLDEVQLILDPLPNPSCYRTALPHLPVAPCIDLGASAIEGTITGAPEGAMLQVWLSEPYQFDGDVIWSRGRSVACEVEGARYRCPPLGFAYSTAHLLTVVHNDKVLFERSVTITVSSCEVITSQYDLQRSPCDIGIWFGVDGRGVAADELTVMVEATETSPAATCTRLSSDALVYRCPGAESTNVSRQVMIVAKDGTTVSARTRASLGCGESGVGFSRPAGIGVVPRESPHLRLTPDQLRALGLQ